MIDRLRIGDDGEVLNPELFEISSTDVLEQVDANKNLLADAQSLKEEGLLAVMKQWENKRSGKGLARECFTFSVKGRGNFDVLTNPIVDEVTALAGHFEISYLGLDRGNFYVLKLGVVDCYSFGNSDVGKKFVDWVSDPFVVLPPEGLLANFYDATSSKILQFHSLLRGQEPGRSLKWKVESDGTNVEILCGDKGDRLRHAASIGVKEAGEMFNKIQERVAGVCRKKAQDFENETLKVRQDLDKLQEEFGIGTKEKRKNG